MKYVQPYGISDADAPYINGDPSIARQGSIPPAAAFEHPMREIVGVIQKNGLPPNSADLLQLVKGTRSQKVNFAEDTGSVNTLSVAFDPPITSYSLGLPIRVRCKNNNSGRGDDRCGGWSRPDSQAHRRASRLRRSNGWRSDRVGV